MRHNFIIIILSCIFSCQPTITETSEFQMLPGSPFAVAEVNDVQNLQEHLQNMSVFELSLNIPSTLIDSLQGSNFERIILGFYSNSDKYAIIGEYYQTADSANQISNVPSPSISSTAFGDTKIYSITSDLFSSFSNDSILLTENSSKGSTVLNKLNKVDRNKNGYNLFMSSTLKDVPFSMVQETIIKDSIQSYIHVSNKDNNLIYSGLFEKDSLMSLQFAHPRVGTLIQAIPAEAETWQSVVIDSSNDNRFLADSLNTADYFDEIGSFKIEGESLYITHLLNVDQIPLQLDDFEEYREIRIYKDSINSIFKNYNHILPEVQTNYYGIIENFILFSNSIAPLKSSINSYLNGQTVINSDYFKSELEHIKSNCSYSSFGNQKTVRSILKEKKLDFNRSIFQLSASGNFFHINASIANYNKNASNTPVQEVANISLDNDLLTAPQVVTNHVTKGKDILVQDVNNNLYLISSKGKVFWKKRINGPILGRVEQIDMYKNGRLQLAFCTESRLYVLDRNGNEVAPFSIKFRDKITQPLSVFDYDSNRNFRLLITQGNELLMLNARGKRVNGFSYSPGAYVTSQPKHFRIGKKDFIVFKTGSNLKILNRKGQNRININTSFDFSDNELYLYQNQITTTDTKGDLIQIDTKGKVNKLNLNLPEDHQLETTSKTLVTQTENALNIKLKSVEQDFGIYTRPQIFYLNDKIYISTTDLQTNKVFLFDSQARAIKGFPVFGTSQSAMANLDNSKGLELVVQTDSKTISILGLQ